mgnify:CR=1 FL=1
MGHWVRMRRQLIGGLALALCLGLFACDGDPSVEESTFEATPEGLALLDSVRGGWQLSGSVQDDCPEEASVPFPLGQSSWTEEDGHLVIEGLGGQAVTLELWPIDGSTFGRDLSVSWGGCEAFQTWTLQIDTLTAGTMSGVFTSETLVNDSLTCVQDTSGLGLPCESRVSWSAVRAQ